MAVLTGRILPGPLLAGHVLAGPVRAVPLLAGPTESGGRGGGVHRLRVTGAGLFRPLPAAAGRAPEARLVCHVLLLVLVTRKLAAVLLAWSLRTRSLHVGRWHARSRHPRIGARMHALLARHALLTGHALLASPSLLTGGAGVTRAIMLATCTIRSRHALLAGRTLVLARHALLIGHALLSYALPSWYAQLTARDVLARHAVLARPAPLAVR